MNENITLDEVMSHGERKEYNVFLTDNELHAAKLFGFGDVEKGISFALQYTLSNALDAPVWNKYTQEYDDNWEDSD